MLPHHRQIVRDTVPVLREHGETITGVFYRQLFEKHPELLHVFNPANQRSGGQAKSLAASILAYAAHIDQLERLGGMVDQIAHKHASLEIQPAHYPIVGEHLLGAIKTVLGEAATPQILEAWAAAYEQLATVMIGRESSLYEDGALQPGGWRGYKPFVLQRRQEESETISSFYLAPQDGQPLPPFQPGQFVGVKVRIPGSEFDQIRQYSLSQIPNEKYYRVSVKREAAPVHDSAAPDGQVSTYLHDKAKEGDVLLVHVPTGQFVLNAASAAPVVLVSGGVGITPAFCMLQSLAQESRREVLFVHATTKGSHHAFGKDVSALSAKYPLVNSVVYYESPEPADTGYSHQGRITLETLSSYLPAGKPEFYYCGPIGFMNAMNGILDQLGVPTAKRYTEAFAPDPSFDKEIAAGN